MTTEDQQERHSALHGPPVQLKAPIPNHRTSATKHKEFGSFAQQVQDLTRVLEVTDSQTIRAQIDSNDFGRLELFGRFEFGLTCPSRMGQGRNGNRLAAHNRCDGLVSQGCVDPKHGHRTDTDSLQTTQPGKVQLLSR